MSWRTIEKELVDILRRDGVSLHYDSGDTFVLYDDRFTIFSITDLAKELMRRGIGQGTPR